MKILSLKVENIGLFHGLHIFDFTPTQSESFHKPITVITGSNGVGKSTLFKCLGLAFHGGLSLTDRYTQHNYQDFITNSLHKKNDLNVPLTCSYGLIELIFDYIQSGKHLEIKITREWKKKKGSARETLLVYCNGSLLDLDPNDYQTWINDLFPPGLASLCFFDAEKLHTLASTNLHDRFIRDAFYKILGVDIIDQLLRDLDRYSLKQDGGTKVTKELQNKSIELQSTINNFNEELISLQQKQDDLKKLIEKLNRDLIAEEGLLASEGGSYIARRPILEERLENLNIEKTRIFNQIEGLTNELLPFCLAPELCINLAQRLINESKFQTLKNVNSLWKEKIIGFNEILRQPQIWEDVNIPEDGQGLLTGRLIEALDTIFNDEVIEENTIIHNLAEPDQNKLLGWIQQVINSIPDQITRLSSIFYALQQKVQKTEAELARVPEINSLSSTYEGLKLLQDELQKTQVELEQIDEQIKLIFDKREKLEGQLQLTIEKLQKVLSNKRKFQLTEQSKAVLKVYKDTLLKQRVMSLENAFVNCFNQLCRKDNLLTHVNINPINFSVEMFAENGDVLNLERFSAGEQQLYALAMLWALREVSGRQLPLAIDTPLARLDDKHRNKLVKSYFPVVSNQVILFATDVEMGLEMLQLISPYTNKLYELKQDKKGQESFVIKFEDSKSQDINLYSLKPQKNNNGSLEKILNNDAEIWFYKTNDLANKDSKLSKAILPAEVNRLVLLDQKYGTYNWLQIAEFAKIVDDTFLFNALRNGKQIYEIWKDEWITLLREAGYDSIATLSKLGPQEYVINPSILKYEITEKALGSEG